MDSSQLNESPSMLYLIFIDVIFILSIAVIISIDLFKIWTNKKSYVKNSSIQSRIIFIFSLIACIPTIIIAIFSTLFFHYGIQSWFNQRINTALRESNEIAKAYLEEHQNLIRADAAVIEKDLNSMLMYNYLNGVNLDFYLTQQARDKDLITAIIFQDKPFRLISQSSFSLFSGIDTTLKKAMVEAKNNIVIIRDSEKVSALIKLDNLGDNKFLLLSRLIDSKVNEHIGKTKEAYSEYQNLNNDIYKKQIQFSIGFLIVSVLLVLSAIWTGISLASAIVKPLFSLLKVTEKIMEGNYSLRVKEGEMNDEITTLSKAFNLMTQQLESQRSNLILANKQIDARRHFSETVISGVSAGIIALNIKKQISMINPQAREIMALTNDDLVGEDIAKLCPEINELLNKLALNNEESLQDQIKISRHKRSIILFVRIIIEILDKETLGYIITFDDITELVIAQRNAAWSDVARRIAHEIKNPLTPIHLAAQRLQKKYSNEVSDPVTFTKYSDTIIKHVTQIGKMVEEFVYFARMPSPKFNDADLNKIVQEIVFSRECIDNNIEYIVSITDDPNTVLCDVEQISQALTNLLKNAEEAFEQSSRQIAAKKIEVTVCKYGDYAIITIEDNGDGFSDDLIDRVTEPYVTNKSSGSGLGLAIVKKILDDHNAVLEFSNREEGGAKVKLMFLKQQTKKLEKLKI